MLKIQLHERDPLPDVDHGVEVHPKHFAWRWDIKEAGARTALIMPWQATPGTVESLWFKPLLKRRLDPRGHKPQPPSTCRMWLEPERNL